MNEKGKREPDTKSVEWICYSCAKRRGGQEPGPQTTWHRGKCSVCKKHTVVTEPRDFGI